MAKFRFTVGTNLVGSDVSDEVEIDDEDLAGREGEEREKVILEVFEQWVWENIDAGWDEVERVSS